MAIICPTVTAEDSSEYKLQMEQITSFATRIHIDLADGVFAANKLIAIKDVWFPAGVKVDVHVMYKTIIPFLDSIIALHPNLVIIHAESVGFFYDVASKLKENDIKVGVALLQQTPVKKIAPAIMNIDHVLVFSGDLGHFGGHAQMSLLSKVAELKRLKPSLEIGWDGGINTDNAKQLKLGGVDVLNVGGAIHSATNPAAAYAKLEAVIEG